MLKNVNELKDLHSRSRSKVALRNPQVKTKVVVYNDPELQPHTARSIANQLVAGAAALGYPYSVVLRESPDAAGKSPLVEVTNSKGKVSLFENVDEQKATEIFRAHLSRDI